MSSCPAVLSAQVTAIPTWLFVHATSLAALPNYHFLMLKVALLLQRLPGCALSLPLFLVGELLLRQLRQEEARLEAIVVGGIGVGSDILNKFVGVKARPLLLEEAVEVVK